MKCFCASASERMYELVAEYAQEKSMMRNCRSWQRSDIGLSAVAGRAEQDDQAGKNYSTSGRNGA